MGSPVVATGAPMDAVTEMRHQQYLRDLYADEAEGAVATIEAKLAGWQAALEAKRAEATQLRAEATEGAAQLAAMEGGQ